MFKSGRAWPVVKAFACCLLVGCAPALQNPAAREPNREPPTSYPLPPGVEAGTSQQATSVAQQAWSEFFSAPELRELIHTAISNNQELNIRLQDIIIAQNEISARQGEYWPKIKAGAGAGIDRVGKYTSQGYSDELTGLPQNLGAFQFGLYGTWEVDIWSKLRDAKNAANLRYFASIEARNFVLTQIIAEVARSYYDIIALDNRLDMLKRNIAIQEKTLELVKLQMQAARVTELAVLRFEAELQKNNSRVYELEQERIQAENRVNFLVGRYPQAVARNEQAFQDPLPNIVQAGLPSQLLENRPDVRQAALELGAAKLDVGVARKAFYPSLTIDAGVGYQAFNVTHLITTPASLVFNAAGGLVAPLLNRNAIIAQYESANAMQVQAVFNYERTLLQAFTDVANQLASVNNMRHFADYLSQEVDTLAHSVDVSMLLFQSARAHYIEVLLARRDYLEAQMEMVDARKRLFQSMVNVYQALGGGWRADPVPGAPEATPQQMQPEQSRPQTPPQEQQKP